MSKEEGGGGGGGGDRFWQLVTFWFGTFVMLYHATRSLAGHEHLKMNDMLF